MSKKANFDDLLLEYLTYQRASIKIISYETIKSRFDLHITPFFKDSKLPIEVTRLIAFKAYLNAKELSQNYKRALFLTLACFLNFCRITFDIDSNINRVKNFKKQPRKRRNFLNELEYSQVRQHFKTLTERAFFDLLFYGGLRRGEALALTSADISGQTITISKTYTKRRIGTPKTFGSYRTVELPQTVIDEIKAVAENGGRIFANLNYSGIKRHFDRAINLAQLPPMRIHDLRHSHISNLLKAGFTPQAIAGRVGHENIETLLNTYAEYRDKEESEICNFLEENIKKGRNNGRFSTESGAGNGKLNPNGI